ncbi:MAG: hypothetical protein LBU62_02850 [Bacteroidales bacterium]|jgi:hypothetical protein|nr:hypothetical protein [Bacteroidales bacterium]
MKKRIFLGVMFCALSVTTQAQEFKDRLFYGGNFGLIIGQFTDIELSPHVGYYITNRWAAGIGFTYEYYNNKYHWQDLNPPHGFERYESHIFGGRLFTNYVLVNNVNDYIPLGLNFRIFAHAEYELMAYEKGFFDYDAQGRKFINSFLLGGGFRFPMGRRSSMNLTLLWKLNSNNMFNDIYGSGPVIRIGYNF